MLRRVVDVRLKVVVITKFLVVLVVPATKEVAAHEKTDAKADDDHSGKTADSDHNQVPCGEAALIIAVEVALNNALVQVDAQPSGAQGRGVG